MLGQIPMRVEHYFRLFSSNCAFFPAFYKTWTNFNVIEIQKKTKKKKYFILRKVLLSKFRIEVIMLDEIHVVVGHVCRGKCGKAS